jgi:hypothetical protein
MGEVDLLQEPYKNTKKIFRNLGLRVVYILDSITMQNLTVHSSQKDQFHSSMYKS